MSSAKIEVVLSLEALQDKHLLAQDKFTAEIHPLNKADAKSILSDAKENSVLSLEALSSGDLLAQVKIDLWAPSSEQNVFKVGHAVAHVHPSKESYNWHGTIVMFRDGGVEVSWKERKGVREGDVLFYQVCDLRLVR